MSQSTALQAFPASLEAILEQAEELLTRRELEALLDIHAQRLERRRSA